MGCGSNSAMAEMWAMGYRSNRVVVETRVVDFCLSGGRGQCDGGSVEIVVWMGYGFWWVLVGIGWAVGWRLGGCGLVFGWPDQWWFGVWVLGFFFVVLVVAGVCVVVGWWWLLLVCWRDRD